jgi:glycerophosphoryl diester phosphodiesterase
MHPPNPSTTVIAHRGASAYLAEHTFAAYALAIEQGADVLELDVRATADGHLVVLHDRTLLRTAGDPRPIDRISAAALAALDPAVRPPTLCAVLDRYADAAPHWLVELKDATPACAHAVAAALAERALADRTVVQSFDASALMRLRSMAPALAVAPLYNRAPSARRLRRVGAFAVAIGVRHTAVDRALLLLARACGLAVRAWTANGPAELERLVTIGVDGVITDAPDVAREVVDRLRALAAAA